MNRQPTRRARVAACCLLVLLALVGPAEQAQAAPDGRAASSVCHVLSGSSAAPGRPREAVVDGWAGEWLPLRIRVRLRSLLPGLFGLADRLPAWARP
ncbi:hypothetical protein A6A06_23645 [Streptomyces sp. CB02923]|nr:hypothetical protein A6A06_23645 [Streptomyces sp. CB02923]